MTTPAQDAPLVLPAVAFRPVRLLVICVALAAVAAVAAALLGVPMVGLFFAIGLALGLTNAVMIQRSVESITAKDHPLKRNMAMNSATRLLIMTVIGLTIAYVFKPQGLGVVFGMALFQVILVASTTLPVVKKLKAQAADADAGSTGGTGLEGETPQQ